MAKVLCVHGVGQELLGPNQLALTWLPALQDGLHVAGSSPLAEHEVAFAFYGDVFRASTTKGLQRPLTVGDLSPGIERDLLLELANTDENAPAPSKSRVPLTLQACMRRLLQVPFMSQVTETVLVLWLKQVALYLQDAKVRGEVQSRVRACLKDETVLVIGHSLGSVIAFDVLSEMSESSVASFITLGSPLGITPTIFDRLAGAKVDDRRQAPPTLRSWNNIVDRGDVVALEKRLANKFTLVVDSRISNGARAHSVLPYLSAFETGLAVQSALSGEQLD